MGQESYVDVQGVFTSDVGAHLADGLKKRQALNVADRAAHFSDHDIGPCLFSDTDNTVLDLVGDVRDRLNGRAQVITTPLFSNDRVIDLPGRKVAGPAQLDIDKALVMSQVEVRFSAISRHEYLAMLIRAHCPRVDVDVRIQLLQRHRDATCLQNTPDGCRGNTFPH